MLELAVLMILAVVYLVLEYWLLLVLCFFVFFFRLRFCFCPAAVAITGKQRCVAPSRKSLMSRPFQSTLTPHCVYIPYCGLLFESSTNSCSWTSIFHSRSSLQTRHFHFRPQCKGRLMRYCWEIFNLCHQLCLFDLIYIVWTQEKVIKEITKALRVW